MSRLALGLVLVTLGFGGAATAQNRESEADRRVQGYITVQEEQAGVNRRCRAGARTGDAITVCAPLNPDANRLPGRDESVSRDMGFPQSPEVGGSGIFRGPATVGNLCLLPPCPRDAIYIVDIDALPPTPKGSDAEKVGTGEMRDR